MKCEFNLYFEILTQKSLCDIASGIDDRNIRYSVIILSQYSLIIIIKYYTMPYKCGKHTRNFGGVFIFILFQFFFSQGAFNKTVIPLALVEYEIVTANSGLRVSLAIYHFIRNA